MYVCVYMYVRVCVFACVCDREGREGVSLHFLIEVWTIGFSLPLNIKEMTIIRQFEYR